MATSKKSTSRKASAARGKASNTGKPAPSKAGRKAPPGAPPPSGPPPLPRGLKPVGPLIHVARIDIDAGTVVPKRAPIVLRPRDSVLWIARSAFTVTVTSGWPDGSRPCLQSRPRDGIHQLRIDFRKLANYAELSYEIRVGDRLIDPTIIVDPHGVLVV
jgi:hypothetical protein